MVGLRVKDKQILICPICREKGDSFGMYEHKKATGQGEEGLSALITQYQTPDNLSLTQDLPSETLLLTEKTAVTLSNIEMSAKLFFVLLEKTKITIGERFSIAWYVDSKDCIRDHGMAREMPFYLSGGVVSRLALENIERMPPSSIGCSLKEIYLDRNGIINILPKLRIHEDSEVELLDLHTDKKEHIAEILSQEQLFFVGRVKKVILGGYAVSVLTKLGIHEDNDVEFLWLHSTEKERVAEILAQDQLLCVGRAKKMEFRDYAVFVFLKIKEVGEGPEGLVLSIGGDELWRKIHEELKKKNTAICIEEVENLFLEKYAVNILPALKTKREIGIFVLGASNEDQISEILSEEYKGISFGGIKKFLLFGSPVNLLPKMRIGEDCEVEVYGLIAEEERQVSKILEKENGSIATGRVKSMKLVGYAVCVIPKLRIPSDNTMEKFVLSGDEWHFPRILGEGDSSIEVGRIKLFGFDVPEEIRRKLRYTLLFGERNDVLEERSVEATAAGDGEVGEVIEREASEVVDGEGSEVLKEGSSSQRGNNLD
ncbi:MAG: uncharacterized protein A8A55_2027 [Amphiamblys sp. WSBS2006]|nr:MAG: uncharacterized protein A8A55_2027 [Amphiamblys sp. WSBS2006]